MELTEESLDDLLNSTYQNLFKSGKENTGTRGATTECLGVTLRLTNPLARISRSKDRGKLFSAIGELLWYLSESDKLEDIEPFVSQYSKEAIKGVIPGAYGPRLFKMRGRINQIDNVINLLESKPSSKRAVVQIFNAEDLDGDNTIEMPCTTSLQFHLRDSALHMSVTMRSNDAYLGLPHDIFCFTMLQEMIAKRLEANLGEYIHHVGSLHIYEEHIESANNYVKEGFQKIEPMPEMPTSDPFKIVPKLLQANEICRRGGTLTPSDLIGHDYWNDIIYLIQAFWTSGNECLLSEISSKLTHKAFETYVQGLSEANPRTKYLLKASTPR